MSDVKEEFKPDFLFDPERIAEGRRWQEELRAKAGSRKLDKTTLALQYSLSCIEAVRKNIRSQNTEGNEEALQFSYRQLYGLLTDTGQAEEAAEVRKLWNSE